MKIITFFKHSYCNIPLKLIQTRIVKRTYVIKYVFRNILNATAFYSSRICVSEITQLILMM